MGLVAYRPAPPMASLMDWVSAWTSCKERCRVGVGEGSVQAGLLLGPCTGWHAWASHPASPLTFRVFASRPFWMPTTLELALDSWDCHSLRGAGAPATQHCE